jgi:hypothetical protein
MCSSSGGQLYEHNFWYNHSLLVADWYAGQDGTPFHLDLHSDQNYMKMYGPKNIKYLRCRLENLQSGINDVG